MEIPKREERETEEIFITIMAENFPKLMLETKPQKKPREYQEE